MKKKRDWGPLGSLLLPIAAVLALVLFTSALSGLESGRSEEDLRQLEDTIRRSCAACYAAEGVYPPDLDYLKERYGVQVDEERYAVFYTAIAENLMPDVTVLVREHET